MRETSHIFPLRRWLESTLVWYSLFVILYLILRFAIQTGWRFIEFLNNLAPYLFIAVIIGFVIALLLRARRLIGVYFLVMLVGVVWVGLAIAPYPLPPAITADEAIPFDLITFNAYPDNPDFDEASQWLSAYAPEILALQELPENPSGLDALNAIYPHVFNTQDRAIFSQYPILESEDIALEHVTIQRVLLDIEGRQVVVYNVHMFMPLNDRETDWVILRYDEKRRDADIQRLLEHVNAETLPVIVAGDFNMTEWSPIYGQFDATLQDAYRRSSWGIGATWPAGASEEFGGGYPRLFRLDYVWYTDHLSATYAVVGAPLGSDHLPLRVELVIE